MRFCISMGFLLLASSAFAADVVYVSVAEEKRISVYQINSNSGELSKVGDVSTAGEPGALTTDPRKRFLFAALRSTGELAAFRIDSVTGKLTHINTVAGGADPAHICVDPEGRFLLTAYYAAGQVTVHEIAADGSLGKKARQTYKTKEKAHAVVFDPQGWGLLIPHTEPNVIYASYWFHKEGEISHIALPGGPETVTPKNTGPRHLVFHPTLRVPGGVDLEAEVAYVANEQGNSVTMYHAILNPINWFLQPKQTLSTLPEGFRGDSACAEIRMHPSNRFLYVSNRGHDSIAAFRVNRESGELTALGQTPTERTPRSFDIDPSGKFLFAAGESSGRLATYRINDETGVLKYEKTCEAGKKPWWVMAVRLPEKIADESEIVKALKARGAEVKESKGGVTSLTVNDGSKLTDDDFRLIGQLTTLKMLTLSNCLNDRQVALLSGLTNLDYLQTNAADVTDAGLKPLAHLKALKTLKFFHPGKSFTGAGLAHLADLPALQSLTVAGSLAFADDGAAAAAKLTSLREFRSWHAGFTDEGVKSLKALKNLKSLYLGQRLTYKPPACPSDQTIALLADMKSLESLQLDEARLSLAALQQLKKLPGLKKLTLGGVDIPKDDVEQLRKDLSDVKVEWTAPNEIYQKRIKALFGDR